MSGGGSKPVDAGTWYYVAYHHGLTLGPIDAFLEFDAGPKIAWIGELTASGAITVNKPGLLGGEKDQGGLVGTLRVMFGEADQERNAYLVSVFGPQTVPWRGFATVAWEGGKYGANNPYPQRASYMIRKIKKGWDNDACWYEEKAEIPVADGLALAADAGGWSYQVTAEEADPGNTNLVVPSSGWTNGAQAPFGNSVSQPANTNWPKWTTLWVKRSITVPLGRAQTLHVQAENGCVVFINGEDVGAINRANDNVTDEPSFDFPLVGGHTYELAIKGFDEAGHIPTSATLLKASTVLPGLTAMNPAHILYFLRTSQDRGREPTENMADDNLRAAADQFHLEGFGLCGTRKAATVSAADYERHICEITDSSFSRSVVDGKWYIDRANGDYDLDSLPILTDDDILSFDETPTVLDNAINSVSVKYFDVLQNRVRTTPAVRALGLIATFGENHQTYDFQEIPNWDMACKVALRKLVAAITPTRGFKLATTPVTRGWRRFQYFRLQSPKRGIADMVCLVGGIEHGKLKSGGINLTAAQDTFSIQDTAYVQYEPGVDTRPDGIASPITQQRAFEAPYFQVLTSMSRADFSALPEDVGYLVGVAADPASSRDFTMTVAPDGGEYAAVRDGPFCPTATVIEASYPMDTAFTLSAGTRLEDVVVGSAVLWDDEICRVDAIDPAAVPPTITLGRGCADTTPAPFHAAGSRLFFYDDAAAGDSTEYTDGETVNVKLLTNTSSDQLDPVGATAMDVTFAQRLLRPYPPGQLRLNGDAYPAEVIGDLAVAFVPRDRVLQADQLVDAEMAGIGPEAGTTYGVELYDTADETLLYSETGIAATPASIPESNLAFSTRLEVYAERDGLQSYQRCTHTFTYDSGAPNIDALISAGPVYIAHRGAALRYPEETNVAYAGALADGLVCVEQDCVLNASGSLVCSHDLNATYVSTSSANYSALTDANVAALTIDASAWFGVTYSPITAMLFRDVLSTYKGQFVFFPEIKDGSATQMAAELTAAGIDGRQAVVSSFTVADLAAAKTAGYRTMLGSSGADVLATAVANNVDYLLYEKGAAAARFTDAVTAGKPVFAYTVERRVTRDGLAALGVSGMYSDDPGYLAVDTPFATSDDFASQAWMPGMVAAMAVGSNDTRATAEYRGRFFASDAWGYDDNATTDTWRGCLQGWACPVAGVAGNDSYAIDTKITFGAPSTSDQTRWAGVAIAATDQAYLDGANGTTNPNSYLFLMRKNGELAIYKRNTAGSTLLASNTDGAAIADDAEVRFRFIVTPEKLRLERLDGSGDVVASAETGDRSAGYRGGYFHFGHSRLPVKFREVSVGAVPTIPWTLFNLATPPALLINDDSPLTIPSASSVSQWSDISGNGYHFTQATSTPQPQRVAAAVNGHRAVDFDGANDYMDGAASTLGLYRNISKGWIAGVYRMDSTDGANTERPILAAATNATATRIGLFASPSNATNKPGFGGRQLDSDPAYIGVVSATSRSLQWVMSLGTVDYIARTEELFINGASDSSGSGLFAGSANTSNTDSVRVRLGAGLGAVTITKLDGKIAMVASGVGSIPSGGEIDKIFGYLAHHFGLAASLPSGHPYKSAPPTV